MVASSGAIGGSSNEDGADFRASVAAWAVSLGLAGHSLSCLDFSPAIPVCVSFETDNSVDDIEIVLRDGARIFVQCKLSVHVGEADPTLRSVVAQWCKAVENSELSSERDRVLLAVKRSTAPVRALSVALIRAKSAIAGLPTSKEAEKLRIIGAHATALHFADKERLHRVALVTPFQSDLALEGITLMRGGVLARPETAEDAWKELKEIARELARNRLGLPILEWSHRLHKRGIQFRSDAGGTPAARAEATRQVLRRYRELLIDRATRMDLRGIGAPLPLFEHDPNKLDPHVAVGDRDSSGWPLMRAFQRFGRVLLLA